MRILVERTRTELLILIFAVPVVAGIISRIVNFNLIDWNSLSLIVVTLWWMTSANYLNKQRGEFDLTLSKIAGTIMIAILITDLLIMDINGLPKERSLFVTALNIPFPLCGFYLVYTLTRVYGSTVNNHEPRGLEIFPNFIYFIIYPIGVWKFQPDIARMAKT